MNKTLLRKIARFMERNPDQFERHLIGVQNSRGSVIYPPRNAPVLAVDGRLPRGYKADIYGLAVALTPKAKRGKDDYYVDICDRLKVPQEVGDCHTAQELRELIRNA